jgi:hypothetical protein
MPVNANSRFNFTPLVMVVDGADQAVENLRTDLPYARPAVTAEQRPDLVAYAVRAGDSWRSLSSRFLGRSDLWWAIAEFTGVIDPFTELSPGRTVPRSGGAVLVPSLDTVMFDLLNFDI